jgi:hypothetical protein
MKRSRKVLLDALCSLEYRVVPSHGGSLGTAAGAHRSTAEVTAAPVIVATAPQPGSSGPFSADVDSTLHSGNPVYESVTTQFDQLRGLSTQYEDRLVVPTGPTSQMTYEWIQLPNGGGLEKVVENTNWQANPNQENVTITFPDGETETKSIATLWRGNRATITETIDDAGGGVETLVGTEVKKPRKTSYNETLTEPSGEALQRKIIINKHGQWNQTEMEATDQPNGGVLGFDTSATTVRMAPPVQLPAQ